MPELTNPRHERFAQYLAAGKSQAAAYRDAGYGHASANDNASRLMKAKESTIRPRVVELQKEHAKMVITKDTVTEILLEAKELAKQERQTATMVAAARELAVLHGHRIEKTETGDAGAFDGKTADETMAYVADLLASFGLELKDESKQLLDAKRKPGDMEQ